MPRTARNTHPNKFIDDPSHQEDKKRVILDKVNLLQSRKSTRNKSNQITGSLNLRVIDTVNKLDRVNAM